MDLSLLIYGIGEGIVQLVFNEKEINPEAFEIANAVRNQYVLEVQGKVQLRAEKEINPDMKTGKVRSSC